MGNTCNKNESKIVPMSNADAVQDNTIDLKYFDFSEDLNPDKLATLNELVLHYTPTTFPLHPIVTHETIKLCQTSWKLMTTVKKEDSFGV